MAQGWKTVAGGMMGAFIVTGLAFVAPSSVRPKLSCSIFS
jgi:hypothetical protein